MKDINTEEEQQRDEVVNSENIDSVNDIPEDLEQKKRFEKKKSEKKDSEKKKAGFIKELIIYALIVLLCVKVVPVYVIQRTQVDGESMMNTLKDEENLLVEKVVWHVTDLKRFDIITFYPEGRDSKKYYIKRVIGLPGEKVQIVGETIYINDKAIKENYAGSSMEYAGTAEEPLQLGDDEYFVLGDNRSISEDSRSQKVGPVKKENIDGRVILRIYPFSKFGTVD